MERCPLIPNGELAEAPSPAHLKTWFGDMSIQEVEERIAFALRETRDTSHNAAVGDKEASSSTFGMGAYERMGLLGIGFSNALA